MADIVLTTLNARFSHCAFGLRYLFANLGDLQPKGILREFDINQAPRQIAEDLLGQQPRVIGFGVYIWNARQTREVVALLKRVRPELTVILGGPEVSFETEDQELARLADYVITGEADLEFAAVCRRLLAGERPAKRIIPSEPPDLARLVMPYDLYTARDIAQRVVYLEASRGCPFTCEFCLSSLDLAVRHFPLQPFLDQMQRLLDRGLEEFRFVDRTFNLNLRVGQEILEFFLARYRPGLFLHFEMIPDRLPAPLREIILRFPAGTLQFEVGLQSLNPEVNRLIQRRQDNGQALENLRYLREQTGVYLHTDLIVGLPGESLASFAEGFDQLVALRPHEIQVGLLKRLRGTPISRHDGPWAMVYSPDPPYEILQNRLLDFGTVQRLRRFARAWDLVVNSGNFVNTAPLIWSGSSPFEWFLAWSDWLYATAGALHGLALDRLAGLLRRYLVEHRGLADQLVARTLAGDYQSAGRTTPPGFLRRSATPVPPSPTRRRKGRWQRQARHWAALGTIRASDNRAGTDASGCGQ